MNQLKLSLISMLRLKGMFFFLFSSFYSYSSNLKASVSTKQVIEGDSFQLHLSNNQPFDQKSLDVLNKDFNVDGVSQGQSIQVINGSYNRSYTISVQLTPKSKGELLIPAIEVKGEKTTPIMISVLDVSNLPKSDLSQGMSLTVMADNDTFFTLQEIPIRLEFKSDKPFLEGRLIVPQSNDFDMVLKKQGKVYETVKNGRIMWVFENEYLLKAKSLGNLTVPSFRLQVLVDNGKSNQKNPFNVSAKLDDIMGFSGNFSANFGGNLGGFSFNMGSPIGEKVNVLSNQLTLSIKSQPKSETGWFLPAKKVVLDDSWQNALPQFKQGEVISRHITLRALGARPEQLPEIDFNPVSSLKVYTENNSIQQYLQEAPTKAYVAERNVKYSIIPTKAGELILPKIKVDWFNTQTSQSETAIIPEQVINVVPATESNSNNRSANQAISNKQKNQQLKSLDTHSNQQQNNIKNDRDDVLEKSTKTEALVTKEVKKTWFDGLKNNGFVVAFLIAVLLFLVFWRLFFSQSKQPHSKDNRVIKKGNFKSDNIKSKQREALLTLETFDRDASIAIKENNQLKLYQSIMVLKRQLPIVINNICLVGMQQQLEQVKYNPSHKESIDMDLMARNLRKVTNEIKKEILIKPSQKKLPKLYPDA